MQVWAALESSKVGVTCTSGRATSAGAAPNTVSPPCLACPGPGGLKTCLVRAKRDNARVNTVRCPPRRRTAPCGTRRPRTRPPDLLNRLGTVEHAEVGDRGIARLLYSAVRT